MGPSWDQVGTKFQLDSEGLQLLVFCKDPKTITELMGYMKWRNRTKFREKYINPLIERGLLEMTIPKKPRSSKQKYRISSIVLETIKKL